jgi:hypothetical protein
MTLRYRVEAYDSDGGNHFGCIVGEDLTLAEARALVRRKLGVSRLAACRLWHPPEGGEAYHNYPPSHRFANGCGGIHIMPENEEV